MLPMVGTMKLIKEDDSDDGRDYEPKVFKIDADHLRDIVREHVETARGMVAALENGVVFEDDKTIKNARLVLKVSSYLVDRIVDGPHMMSFPEYWEFRRRFSPFKTADEVLADQAEKRAKGNGHNDSNALTPDEKRALGLAS